MKSIMVFRQSLILYMRPDCHLCDQVIAMLQSMGVPFSPEDIENDPELEQKYGLLIPVLFLPETGQELFFPFDSDQLRTYLGDRV